MMKMITFIFLMLNSFSIIYIWHPLKMMIMILFQTIFCCIYMSMTIKFSWMSYLLLLLFAGSLLILLAYMTVIASNEMMDIKMNLIIIYLIFMIMLFMLTSNNDIILYKFLNNKDIFNSLNLNKMMSFLTKMYNNFSFLLSFILINYLFIVLLISNKITNVLTGPLRKFN